MYKIVVVDDEPLIARTICQIIAKVTNVFEVVAVAHDGESALEQIFEHRPEIVFTDIKMPKMSGLELAQIIREHCPDTKVVILSGYGEFDYAVTAIKAGVAEYLLKPVNREKMAEILEALEKQINLRYHTAQLNILNAICNHTSQKFTEDEFTKYFPYQSYAIMVSCQGSYLHAPIEWSDKSLDLESGNYLYESVWKQKVEEPHWIVNGYKPNEKILIIGGQPEQQLELKKKMAELHQFWNKKERPITSVIDVFSGTDSEKIKAHIFDSSQFLKRTIRFSHSQFLDFTEEEKTTESKFNLSEEEIHYLAVLFQQKQYDHLRQNIFRIFEEFQQENLTQMKIEQILKNILLAMINKMDVEVSYQECVENLYEGIGYCHNWDELFQAYYEIIEELIEVREDKDYHNIPQNQIAQQVRKYITDHYTQTINIQTIAMDFGVVAPYLSRIYSDYYGTTIKNDILELRIKRAEELLKIQPPLPLREIADLSGFNDQFYFSKVFKKYHQISPVDFRKLLNDEITI